MNGHVDNNGLPRHVTRNTLRVPVISFASIILCVIRLLLPIAAVL
jgi:hypothetical protein